MAGAKGQGGSLLELLTHAPFLESSVSLSLLLGGVFSPTVWRPPLVWHKIKAHEYHNNQSVGLLLQPRSFVGLLHLRPTR